MSMKRWSGGDMRCQKCNKYLPDRCTCNGPSIEEQRSMTHESNPNRAPAAPDHDNETGRRVYDDPHGRVAARYPVAPVPASTGVGLRSAIEKALDGVTIEDGTTRVFNLVVDDILREILAASELDADAERRALSKRLREHNDPRLYREADVLMSEAADALDRATAESAPIDAMRQAIFVLRAAIEAQLAPTWECNSDHPALRAALDDTKRFSGPDVESAPSSAAPREQSKRIPREHNDKLIELARYWKIDGDWMTCKGCKRSLIASRDGEELNHAHGCKFAAQQHPWAQLRAVVAPSNSPVGAKEQDNG